MEDVFQRLSAGVRFSRGAVVQERKREKRLLLILKSKDGSGSKTKAKGKDTTEAQAEGRHDPDPLDFFGSKARVEETEEKVEPAPKMRLKRVARKPVFTSAAEMHQFRKEHNIRVYGEDVPDPVARFSHLCNEHRVSKALASAILADGLKRPTPVQMQATTVMLAGRDAFVVAPTGSGKTLVFVIAILAHLFKSQHSLPKKTPKVAALVISPTRELAAQIKDQFRRFIPKENGRHFVGSVLLNKAVLNSWRAKAPLAYPQILISTPKRLIHAIDQKIIDLSCVQQIILDEGDKLLDLGLMEQIDDILAACSYKEGPIQKALFSATIPTGVEDLARSFMNEDPIRVVVGTLNAATTTIKQELVYVGQEEGKLVAIRQMLVQGIEPPVIIFTETIDRAQELFRELVLHGINVDVIHSHRSQAERERIISQFRSGRIWFLITTELLARGLDFEDVSCVINYDFPASTASYIHRIGRTGRAGKAGRAITFFTREDALSLSIVVNVMQQSGCSVPEWMRLMPRRYRKPTSRVRRAR